MDPTFLSTNVAYLVALSMAAERLVEILRGFPLFAFPKKTPPPGPQGPVTDVAVAQDEAKRVAKINLLSVVTGIITAALAYIIHALPAGNWGNVLIFGVLAGAGSGFWNAVLSYLLQLKNNLPTAPTQVPVETKIARAA